MFSCAARARSAEARSAEFPDTTRREKFSSLFRRIRNQSGQNIMSQSPADPPDVKSIDGIIAAIYDVISGPAGQKRDWERERSLFIPGARLIPTATMPGKTDVDLAPLMLDVDGYIERVEPIFAKSGFYEKEIARRVEQFGRMAQVWST